jgi:foldase protein PrsA
VQNLADSLLQAARDGADFAELAKEFSTDNSTRAQGGELGWISTMQAPPDIAPTLKGWQTPGEYRGPVQTSSGIHILKLLDYAAEKAYSLEDDFDSIKELARQDKTGRLVDKWIAELKTKTYIDYRLDENAN